MIKILSAENGDVKCNIDEAVRYMGYGKQKPDTHTMNTIQNCCKELESVLRCTCCYSEIGITVEPQKAVNCEIGSFKSVNLAKHLDGCKTMAVFCATIGIEADRLIKRYGITSPAKSVICDALASSAIEVWCDIINETIVDKRIARSRYSAGYGDFDIKYQKAMIDFLNTPKNCGVNITDSMMLLPSKSVTAVIGIGADNCGDFKKIKKCEECGNINCEYRNG